MSSDRKPGDLTRAAAAAPALDLPPVIFEPSALTFVIDNAPGDARAVAVAELEALSAWMADCSRSFEQSAPMRRKEVFRMSLTSMEFENEDGTVTQVPLGSGSCLILDCNLSGDMVFNDVRLVDARVTPSTEELYGTDGKSESGFPSCKHGVHLFDECDACKKPAGSGG